MNQVIYFSVDVRANSWTFQGRGDSVSAAVVEALNGVRGYRQRIEGNAPPPLGQQSALHELERQLQELLASAVYPDLPALVEQLQELVARHQLILLEVQEQLDPPQGRPA